MAFFTERNIKFRTVQASSQRFHWWGTRTDFDMDTVQQHDVSIPPARIKSWLKKFTVAGFLVAIVLDAGIVVGNVPANASEAAHFCAAILVMGILAGATFGVASARRGGMMEARAMEDQAIRDREWARAPLLSWRRLTLANMPFAVVREEDWESFKDSLFHVGRPF